ncbi:hypothetical protein [Salinicoccus roseus]|uniref:Uncharacterized protein n=1 Tax=Salinicoccus roseus TaxID=45670 RepID=A0A265E7P5_9STAP|nr:hypothetical protein [Salinicoccus roseus]OZT77515.1 hypothetical protein CFN03_06140 [Salinicoccus roseus]
MARKNYFEILKEQGFNSRKEINDIQVLLDESYHSLSLRRLIEEEFRNYKNRGSFIYFHHLEEAIKVEYDFHDDYLFGYTEMLLDIFKEIVIPEIETLTSQYIKTFLLQQHETIFHQIETFLAKSNHEILENGDGNLIIVEKHALANQASQIISDVSLKNAIRILEYNHFSNAGNIESKKQILLSLAGLLEPKREELNTALGELFKKSKGGNVLIISDLFEMFNKLHLRHNNNNQYISTENDQELEYWYDNVYNTILMVIVSEEQVGIHEEFREFKEIRN